MHIAICRKLRSNVLAVSWSVHPEFTLRNRSNAWSWASNFVRNPARESKMLQCRSKMSKDWHDLHVAYPSWTADYPGEYAGRRKHRPLEWRIRHFETFPRLGIPRNPLRPVLSLPRSSRKTAKSIWIFHSTLTLTSMIWTGWDYIGSSWKSFAASLNLAMLLEKSSRANWESIFFARREFGISKLPHKVWT